MAKRKRLDPAALVGVAGPETGSDRPTGSGMAPPIAQVAGAAAAQAAAHELAGELAAARAEGRLVQDIALTDIAEDHLSRDRVGTDLADMAALEASITARGQQTPIDLVDLGPEAAGPRYGLISGWRRLQAIKRLRAATGEARFDTIRAVLRRPDGAAEAYLSMVEENELRVGLSYYERAQVAARAAADGVFDSSSAAVAALFPTASKAKRSKINAFVRIFHVLGAVLHYPEALPERLGLRLAKALDAGQGSDLYAALAGRPRPEDAAAELARLVEVLAPKKGSNPPHRVADAGFACGVELTRARGALKLSGPGVDADLQRDLEAWLAARPGLK